MTLHTDTSSTAAASAPSRKRRREKMSKARRHEALEGVLYISPWIIGFLLFIAGPLFASMFLSLTKYNVLRPPEFIGISNYVVAFFEDPLFWQSIGRTFYNALLFMPLAMLGSLVVAVLLNQQLFGTAFWRTFYFLPTLTPLVAAALLWKWLLNPDFGLVNYALEQIGIDGPLWLGSPRWAIPSLVIMGLWGSIGGSRMIIFLAGLQDVPRELLEAAEIDGAGIWKRFRHVTLPLLTPTIFFNLILGVIFALRSFEAAFVATQGGPARATWFFALHIYENAFVRFDMGYAAALSWIFFVLLFSLTYLQFRLSGSWVFYQGERN